jgi:uncharacterized protein (TIGR02271 family)
MPVRTTAVAIFEDRADAQRAIEHLKRAGFTDKEIGVTARDDIDSDASAANTDKGETHAKEGAIAGVAAGAGVGALWGLGILAGVLPAIGPAIAGGTLAAILSSAAAGAATAGLAGTLIGLGIPEEEANYYDREFRAGRTVVTVRADGRLEDVQAILQQNGGRDMHSNFDTATPEPFARTTTRAASPGAGVRPDALEVEDRRTLEAREEEVRIRKRPVQTGEAEIYKEIRTERHSVDVPVKKEELVIERHSVGRHPASGPIGENERVRIPLSEEQVEVEKKPVVTERVSVGKRATQEEEHVDTTVRKENIKVDKRGRSDTRSGPR